MHLSSPVAQSVEQLTVNQWVTGSSPVRGARLNEIAQISIPLNSDDFVI